MCIRDSTYIRASNDNGKLRIENLSTQKLDVTFDKDGDGVGAATNHSIGGNSVRASLADEYNDLKNKLDRLSDDASFNGINLLRGDNLRITFNESGNSFIEIQTPGADGINAATLKLDHLTAIQLDQDLDIDALLAEVKQALNTVRTQASKFGSNLSIVQNRQDFTKEMINTLQTGAANLTLADMNEEAANLLALQTRQSLSSSSLSLASQADQSVLQLLQ
jgi:flagellin-like hook-associated protein FlgL